MNYLVRMIKSKCKWYESLENPAIINADIFSDLVSEDNCISTWIIDNTTEDEINKAVLAITSAFKNPDPIILLLVDEDSIIKNGINVIFSPEDAKTCANGYEKYHKNIINLNYNNMGLLAQCFMNSITDGIKEIRREDVADKLINAIKSNIVCYSKMDKNMKREIANIINKNNINLMEFPEGTRNEIKNQINLNNIKNKCRYEKCCQKKKCDCEQHSA